MTEPVNYTQEFQRLLDADPIGTDTDQVYAEGADTISEDDLDNALSVVGLEHLSPEAQAMVLGLTYSSTSIDSEARMKLMGAAARALRTRRDRSSALPRLLFLSRRSTQESAEEVAAAIDVPADKLKEIEMGTARVDALGPKTVANWLRHFNVSAEEASVPLRRCFVAPELHDVAAALTADVRAEADKFVDEVLSELGS